VYGGSIVCTITPRRQNASAITSSVGRWRPGTEAARGAGAAILPAPAMALMMERPPTVNVTTAQPTPLALAYPSAA
jgi:hypothetical protein